MALHHVSPVGEVQRTAPELAGSVSQFSHELSAPQAAWPEYGVLEEVVMVEGGQGMTDRQDDDGPAYN